ncbi:MAG: NlpC/P60 family protein [Flavobacteriales bacterium]
MKYGICQVVLSPGRAEPADQAEIKMQLVFGDLVYVIEIKDNWTKLKMAKYEYECWVDTKHICLIQEEEFNQIYSQKEIRVKDITSSLVNSKNNEITHLVKGCLLPNYDNKSVSFGNHSYKFLGNTNHGLDSNKKEIEKTALEYLNSPYLWGGNSPYGIDCSGLTQMTYLLHNIQIPRDACDQGTVGETVDFIEEAEPGDLIYFDNSEGKIHHVGILLSGNKILHASGHVRIDSIDHQGIFRKDMDKYTHKLRIIKKMF